KLPQDGGIAGGEGIVAGVGGGDAVAARGEGRGRERRPPGGVQGDGRQQGAAVVEAHRPGGDNPRGGGVGYGGGGGDRTAGGDRVARGGQGGRGEGPLELEGADVHVAAGDAGQAALVGGEARREGDVAAGG